MLQHMEKWEKSILVEKSDIAPLSLRHACEEEKTSTTYV